MKLPQVQGTDIPDTSSCQMVESHKNLEILVLPGSCYSVLSIQGNTEISWEYITWDEFVIWLMSLGQDEVSVLGTGSD